MGCLTGERIEAVKLSEEELDDLFSGLQRAHEDLTYLKGEHGNYDPEDMPGVEAQLRRWEALMDRLDKTVPDA